MPADFQRAMLSKDLPPGSMKTVNIAGEDVLLVNTEGKYYGMGAICTHEEWDLSEGSLDGHFVTCAGHGSVWDLTNGTAEFDEPLDPQPLYEVVEREDGFLYARRSG